MRKILKNSNGQVFISSNSAYLADATLDSNIIASNIKKGVEILGVTGTYGPSTDHTVQWVDFDGTVLKEEVVADGGSSTAPSDPSHDYLTFDGWEKGTTLTGITEDMWNLAYYHVTDASKVYYGVNVPSGDETFITLYNTVGSTSTYFTIDWGDGSSEQQQYTTAKSYVQYAHTYTSAFNGYVTVSVTSGAITAPCRNALKNSGSYKNVETILIGNNHTLGAYHYRGYLQSRRELKGVVLPVKTAATTIDSYTFASTNIQFAHIPDCYTKLPMYMFYNCPLKDIVLPDTLVSIGDCAFQYSDLTTIELPDGVTSASNWMCSDCTNLKRVKLGNAFTTLVQGSFYNCTNLSEINLPTTITTINNRVFQNCTNLSIEINLPNLTTFNCNSNGSPFNNSGIRRITNLGSITSLPYNAFARCELDVLNIPSTVTTAGETCFAYMDMPDFTVPSTITSASSKSIFAESNFETLDLSNITGTFLTSSLSKLNYLKSITFGAGMTITYTTTAISFNSPLESISCGSGFELTNSLNLQMCNNIPISTMVTFFTNLGTYTGSNTITITLPKIILNRLTDAQKAIATDKGYVLA